MYFVIGKFIGIFLGVLILISPFIPKLRRKILGLADVDDCPPLLLYSVLEQKELETLGKALLFFMGYLLFLFFTILAVLILVFIWPGVLLGLLVGIMLKKFYSN